MTELMSIGHSTLDYGQFVRHLRRNNITAVADVRSSPYSRNFPHYNREPFKGALAEDGIAYAFLGKELGGRPTSREYFTNGVADYEKMATAPAFRLGLDRLEEGASKFKIAIMCSERNPLDCHRCLLVGRQLLMRGLTVNHIVSEHNIITQVQIESRLLAIAGKDSRDMFDSTASSLNAAYRERSRKVAFAEGDSPRNDKVAAE